MAKRASKIAGFKRGPVIVQCRLIPGLEVSVDPAGRSPLRYAALSNDHAEVTRLIAAGETPDSPDSQGFTPLHLGIQEHAIAAATALLNQSASDDQTNTFGTTPLFVAVFTSHGRPRGSICYVHAVRSIPI